MNTTAESLVADDRILDEHGLAAVTLSINWSDALASHQEQIHVDKFSVWREADLLPAEIAGAIPGMYRGEVCRTSGAGIELMGKWNSALLKRALPRQFDGHHRRGLVVQPRLGRFYPQGFFHDIPGLFEDGVNPARITELTETRMTVDLNHPMAGRLCQVGVKVDEVLTGYDRRGGRCVSPLDDLLQFSGLAAPLTDGRPTDFVGDVSNLARMDEGSDERFYAKARMVQHLDRQALNHVNALYRRLIPRSADVLDLMASYDSHLQGVPFDSLRLLGMNRDELDANRAAAGGDVRDLNLNPELPYGEHTRDCVVCTASIEYLTHPAEVLSEVMRVLRPGGVFIVTFSNRWFHTKAIRIWSDLHEFERVGMVVQWMHEAGFTDLETVSLRGWPRPADDAHADKSALSDPVYGVWGYKR